jgi:hypothetical protein
MIRNAITAPTSASAEPIPISARRDGLRKGFRGGFGAKVASAVDRIVAPVDPSQRARPAIVFQFGA